MSAKHGGRSKNLPPDESKMPAERAEIITWLKKVKFRRRLFGGVDERNVWKRLSELDALYTKALEAERTRYDALLSDYKKRAEEKIGELVLSVKGGDSGG